MKPRLSALVGSIVWAAFSFAALAPAQAGCVEGIVRSFTGKPVAGAVVTAIESGARSLTNADGRYYLPNIPPGRMDVAATSAGYLPSVAAVTVQETGITDRAFALKADKSYQAVVPSPQSIITTKQWQPPTVTQSGSVEDGWQITAKSDKASYQPGEPIHVTVSVKNVSEKDAYLEDDGDDFEFAVTRYGVEMPATEYGVKIREDWVSFQKRRLYGGPPHQLYGPVHPGQARDYQFIVNLFRDMTLGGTYTVVVDRNADSSTQLVADPVQVAILFSGGGIY